MAGRPRMRLGAHRNAAVGGHVQGQLELPPPRPLAPTHQLTVVVDAAEADLGEVVVQPVGGDAAGADGLMHQLVLQALNHAQIGLTVGPHRHQGVAGRPRAAIGARDRSLCTS